MTIEGGGLPDWSSYKTDPDWRILSSVMSADEYAKWCWREHQKLKRIRIHYELVEEDAPVNPKDMATLLHSQQKLLLRASSLAQFCTTMAMELGRELEGDEAPEPTPVQERPTRMPWWGWALVAGFVLQGVVVGLVLLLT